MAREDLELGPCAVYIRTVGGAEALTDLGRTEGSVRVAFTTDVADLMSDQWGTQPEEQVITGQGCRVTVPFADYTYTNLALALNQTLDASGIYIEGARLVGTKMSSKAIYLRLKKYVAGAVSEDAENWMDFPVAAPVGNPEVLFSKSDQRIIEVEFVCFPDDDDILYYLGDEGAS